MATATVRRLSGAGALVLLVAGLSACDAGNAEPGAEGPGDTTTSIGPDGTPTVVDESGDPVRPKVRVNVKKKAAGVPVSKLVTVTTSAGSLTDVKVTSTNGELLGDLSDDGTTWTAADRLEPGTKYTVKAAADMSKYLLCPMPGLVKAINTSEGLDVKAGDALAVVEAMKMENILRAERDGKVKKVNAKPGDSLAVDAVILEFA